MNDLDFSFEEHPWEAYFAEKGSGDRVPAVELLTLLEGEEEDSIEDAFQTLEERKLILDIANLPKAPGTGEAAVRLRREEALAQNGLRYEELSEHDPLRLYLEEIALTPAAGDEDVLAMEAASGNVVAMEQLTNLGLSRVISLACGHVGHGVLLLDLIQEGSLGLWQAIQSYASGDYRAHRDYYIQNALAKAVLLQARSSGVGQKMRQALEDYRAVDERLLTDLGRNPTVEEIADEMHMSVAETEVVRKMLEDARLLQQAGKGSEPEELPQEEDQAVEDTAYFQARQRILELLSTLSEEDAKLLTLRFGLEKGLPLSPEETGRRLGMTSEEVVAREARALALLRGEI